MEGHEKPTVEAQHSHLFSWIEIRSFESQDTNSEWIFSLFVSASLSWHRAQRIKQWGSDTGGERNYSLLKYFLCWLILLTAFLHQLHSRVLFHQPWRHNKVNKYALFYLTRLCLNIWNRVGEKEAENEWEEEESTLTGLQWNLDPPGFICLHNSFSSGHPHFSLLFFH